MLPVLIGSHVSAVWNDVGFPVALAGAGPQPAGSKKAQQCAGCPARLNRAKGRQYKRAGLPICQRCYDTDRCKVAAPIADAAAPHLPPAAIPRTWSHPSAARHPLQPFLSLFLVLSFWYASTRPGLCLSSSPASASSRTPTLVLFGSVHQWIFKICQVSHLICCCADHEMRCEAIGLICMRSERRAEGTLAR